MKKLRKFGNITSDLEDILEEMSFDHDMQHGEVLAQVRNWLEVHAPSQKEEYEDGTEIVYYYGPKEENGKQKTNRRRSKKTKKTIL